MRTFCSFDWVIFVSRSFHKWKAVATDLLHFQKVYPLFLHFYWWIIKFLGHTLFLRTLLALLYCFLALVFLFSPSVSDLIVFFHDTKMILFFFLIFVVEQLCCDIFFLGTRCTFQFVNLNISFLWGKYIAFLSKESILLFKMLHS